MDRVLEGVQVIDFGRYIAGPFCAALLGDLGADVIRVERVDGGEDRFVVPVADDGAGSMYLQCNRNKRGMTLNPAKPEGREVVRRLVANADVEVARTNLNKAILDLEFTEVRAPVDGYVTHLKLRYGTQTVANQPAVALVDAGSFWVHGFFKETQIRNIRPGNKAVVKLMTYPDQPLEGVVDNMGWGIAQKDGSPDADLLPTINPSFDWIRLAQRIPVRIRLTHIPEGVDLRVGTTASVFVTTE